MPLKISNWASLSQSLAVKQRNGPVKVAMYCAVIAAPTLGPSRQYPLQSAVQIPVQMAELQPQTA